jgi:hypothetical protein
MAVESPLIFSERKYIATNANAVVPPAFSVIPLLNFSLPVLGFSDRPPEDSVRVEWRDGTVVYCGILGKFDADTIAAEARKEELRQQPNVILIEDHR